MSDRYIDLIKRYLDGVYNDLDCVITPSHITWSKNGKEIAGIWYNSNRLRLSSTEFNSFRHMFSLPWDTDEDSILLLDLIVPYLKFNGGSPAVPVLRDAGYMRELTEIALPSSWN